MHTDDSLQGATLAFWLELKVSGSETGSAQENECCSLNVRFMYKAPYQDYSNRGMGHLADITIRQSAAALAFAKTFEGTPYQPGAGQNSNPASGFDCSGFIWYVLTQQGFNYPYAPTNAMANSQSWRQLNLPPEVVNAGDLILFNGHAGFFDPNPPISGKTLYSATTTGGVHNENPIYFGSIVGYYRLQI